MAELIIDVKVNNDGSVTALNNKINQTQTATSKLKSKFDSLLTSLSRVATVGVIGAFAGIAAAINKTVKSGFDFNASMEQQKAGLVALAMAVNKDAIPATEKLALAQREAAIVMEELLRINEKTPHTLSQTNEIYKAMYVSMKAAGASTADIIGLTEKLSIAAGAAGIGFNQLLAGVDGLATGTVMANSDLGRFLSSLGLTNTALENTNDVVALVNNALQDFTGFDTMGTSVSNLQNQWDMLAGKLTKDIFYSVKDSIDITTAKMKNLDKEGIELLKQKFNDMALVIAKAAGGVVKAIGWIADKIYALTTLFQNAYIQLTNLFSWTDELQAKVEANRQSYINFSKSVDDANAAVTEIIGTFEAGIEKSKELAIATKENERANIALKAVKDALRIAIDAENEAEQRLRVIRGLSTTTTEQIMDAEIVLSQRREEVKAITDQASKLEKELSENRKDTGEETISLAERTEILTKKKKALGYTIVETEEKLKDYSKTLWETSISLNDLNMATDQYMWTSKSAYSQALSQQEGMREGFEENVYTPIHETDFSRDGAFGMKGVSGEPLGSDGDISFVSDLGYQQGYNTGYSYSSNVDRGYRAGSAKGGKMTMGGDWQGGAITMKNNGGGGRSGGGRVYGITSMHTTLNSWSEISNKFVYAEGGSMLGFSSGGYTGNGGINDIAGVVHGKEYVMDAKQTKAAGLDSGSDNIFTEIREHNKNIIRLLRENNRQNLSIISQRG